MSKKKKRSLFGLIATIPTLFSLFNHLTGVISHETLEVKKSLKKILVIRFLLGPLLTASWLSLLSMLYLALVSLHVNPILSLFIIFLLNIIILMILGIIFVKAKNKLSFPSTRHFIRHLLRF